MSTVDQIKEKLNIADVISRYIKLEKAGANLKAKCPFHHEKTASFFISPGRGTYYCFGCGAKGDAFTFVQEFERVDFLGSLKILAEAAGVPIVFEKNLDKNLKSEKEKLLSILEASTDFYQKNLTKHPEILDYLKKRGLKERIIGDWRLGYVEEGWQNLLDHLKSKGFAEADIEKAGLIKKGEDKSRGSGLYDRFRGRIMFPIFDSSGRPVGFSGRTSDENNKEAKYINSPEGPLFNKSSVLYGYDRAKNAIREQNYGILVEGQMDLLLMHQAGLRNSVASSGTALSEEHLKMLKRNSENLLLAYDGDGAGLKAALRAWHLALSMGMEIKIASMPQGEDPASLIAKDPELMKKALSNSTHIINFYLEVVLTQQKDKRKVAKAMEKEILPLVRSLASSVDQAHFISIISEKTAIKEEALYEELNKIQLEETEEEISTLPKMIGDDFLARRLWGLVFWQEKEKSSDLDLGIIRNKLKEIGSEEPSEQAELIFEAEIYYGDNADLSKEVEGMLWQLARDYLKNKFSQTMSLLQQAEKNHDKEKAAKLLNECHKISEMLSEKKIPSLNAK